MIGAMCVNTLMCTTVVAWLTLVDIWKGKIKQEKGNLYYEWTLNTFNYIAKTQLHNCTVLTLKLHWILFLIFSISVLVQLMAWCWPGDEILLYRWSFHIFRQLASWMNYLCWMPGPAVVSIMTPRETGTCSLPWMCILHIRWYFIYLISLSQFTSLLKNTLFHSSNSNVMSKKKRSSNGHSNRPSEMTSDDQNLV